MRLRKPLILYNTQTQIRRYQQRVVIVLMGIFILLGGLTARLVYLQVIEHHYYLTLSKQNLLSVAPIDPNRGLIYDRNNVLIAENIPVFSLEIAPKKVNNINTVLKALSKVIDLSYMDIKQFQKQLAQNSQFNTLPVKIKLSDKEMARFAVNQYRFPGIFIQPHMVRYYPYGELLAPVLGYVGRINAQELLKVDSTNYSASNYIGKMGIEKYDEKLLHGSVGVAQIETSAAGNIVRSWQNTPPVAGQNLYLSIDTQLQAAVDQDLKDQVGGAVIMDAQTGEILAMVSKPSFDPNLFVTGIQQKTYTALEKNPDRPLFNRILQGEFPSGSTIKPFYALEALSSGITSPDEYINDPGFFKLPQHAHVYRDDRKGGHGLVNIEKAIIVSCDTYFFQLAYKMGINRMDNILSAFGFGKETGIDTYIERKGLVPSPSWKEKAHHQQWFEGDMISFGIGQGYFLVTPIQLATGLMHLINQGRGFQPHFLIKTDSPAGEVFKPPLIALKSIDLPEKYGDLVIKAMREVVSDPRGTGYRAGHDAPYTFGGKSGTAQVFSLKGNQKDKASLLPKRLRDHSWFMAFAPAKNPHIIAVVFLEHGGEGNAQIYMRRILDSYFSLHPLKLPSSVQQSNQENNK